MPLQPGFLLVDAHELLQHLGRRQPHSPRQLAERLERRPPNPGLQLRNELPAQARRRGQPLLRIERLLPHLQHQTPEALGKGLSFVHNKKFSTNYRPLRNALYAKM